MSSQAEVLTPRQDLTQRWARSSASLGGAVWIILGVRFLLHHGPLGPIELFFLLAPLVAVPLGLELLSLPGRAGSGSRALLLARLLQPLGAAALVVAFSRGGGGQQLLWSFPWVVVTGLAGVAGLARLPQTRGVAGACATAALLYLPVGGVGLLISRLGLTPLGFQEPIPLLFAVHYHYSGFVAPLLAGELARRLGPGFPRSRKAMRPAAAGIVVSPLLIALGFVLDWPLLRLLGVFVLAASLVGLAVLHAPLLRVVRRPLPRLLLGIAAAALVPSMALAVAYGLGDWAGRIYVSIPRMAVTHGLLNGLGFAVSGLLGWLALGEGRAEEP